VTNPVRTRPRTKLGDVSCVCTSNSIVLASHSDYGCYEWSRVSGPEKRTYQEVGGGSDILLLAPPGTLFVQPTPRKFCRLGLTSDSFFKCVIREFIQDAIRQTAIRSNVLVDERPFSVRIGFRPDIPYKTMDNVTILGAFVAAIREYGLGYNGVDGDSRRCSFHVVRQRGT
jgi:hypothetical protein